MLRADGAAAGIDRRFVVDAIFLGHARPSNGPVPAWDTQFHAADVAPAAFDVARANALLDEAGHPRGAGGMRFRLRILPADPTTGQQTAVAAGKYVTRRAYVEIVTDGAGYSATRLEYRVTRWLSLLSTISTIGRQSASVRVSKDY